ncbi:hypothetical protein COD94_25280 [Bacillus cereus]|nr:hypothetical protein COD94_25280 [Bacillus cereus]
MYVSVIPSSCRVPKKREANKNNSKINFYCIFWSYLTFTLQRKRTATLPKTWALITSINT